MKYLRPHSFTREVTIIPNCLLRRSEIGLTAKLVWSLLARCSAGKNCAYPSQDWIAGQLGVQRGTIGRAIEELVSAGYLEKQVRFQQAALYYFLNHDAFREFTSDAQDDPGDARRPTADRDIEKWFEQFIERYPAKRYEDWTCQMWVSMFSAIQQDQRRPLFDEIMAGLERHMASQDWRDDKGDLRATRYIPGPDKFLGFPRRPGEAVTRMWKDRPEPWRPRGYVPYQTEQAPTTSGEYEPPKFCDCGAVIPLGSSTCATCKSAPPLFANPLAPLPDVVISCS